ncbi:hypothetical protein LSAT2_022223 [Lamellibrachia satsuma]|nr:hypothetical protein LSAT2_022223 [Lamellibrachia satsuma]
MRNLAHFRWQEKRAKTVPTTEYSTSYDEVLPVIPPEIPTQHTSSDIPPETIPVLPDGWTSQDAAAHLRKRSWLRIRDEYL